MGKEESIIYGVHSTLFGQCLIGIQGQAVCHLSFIDGKKVPKNAIKDESKTKKFIERIFKHKKPVVVSMKGTEFQKKVWDALCEIPLGHTSSYADIAEAVGMPKAVRAVGTACGKNSIAFLIPCHRVLTSDGKIGGYKWGTKRKKAILEWEQSLN